MIMKSTYNTQVSQKIMGFIAQQEKVEFIGKKIFLMTNLPVCTVYALDRLQM